MAPGQTLTSILNSVDPNLEPFRAHGGKLIQYHGFSDPEVPPRTSINYFESVLNLSRGPSREIQDETEGFYRLFMVPGMNHCKGGPGANVFDMVAPLVQWMEHDIAPDEILATHYVNNDPDRGIAFTRPLCSYPREAVYKGNGSINNASNF